MVSPRGWRRTRRVLRCFRRHGLLDEADAHGMMSWQGSGGFSIDAMDAGDDTLIEPTVEAGDIWRACRPSRPCGSR